MATNLLRLAEVKERTSLGTSTIYRLMDKGKFPKPAKIGGAARWSSEEIDAFVQRAIDERDAKAAA